MYNIKILTNEEFDSLPYPEVELSLGLADPITNTAYIRATGVHELDKHVVMHELDHLVEGGGGKHADHYRNGVYYKSGGSIVKMVAPALISLIPGIGPIAAAGMGGLMAASDASRAKNQQKSADNLARQKASQTPAGGSPMDSFSPGGDSGPDLTPQPNIVTPGGLGGGATQSGGGMPQGSPIGRIQSVLERSKGYFQGRAPGTFQSSGGV